MTNEQARTVTPDDLKRLANTPYFGAGITLDNMGHRAAPKPGENTTYVVKVEWSVSYEDEIEIEAASEGEALRLAREEIEAGLHTGNDVHIEIHDAEVAA